MQSITGKKRFYVSGVVAAAILFATISSLRWVIPLRQQGDSYVPIRFQITEAIPFSDDYLYFSQVPEFLTGNWLLKDPSSYEGKEGKAFPLHVTYSVSMALVSLGALLTKSTEHAFYFSHTVFPAIATGLMGVIVWQLTQSPWVFLLLMAVVFPHSPRWLVIPHCSATQLPLLVLVSLLIASSKSEKKHWGRILAMAAVVGLSPLTAVPNFFISFSLLGLSAAQPFWRRAFNNERLQALGLASLIALPSIILILMNRDTFARNLEFAIPPVSQYSQFIPKNFLLGLFYFSLPLGFVASFRSRNKILYVTYMGAFLLAYVALSLYHGTFAGSYVVTTGRTTLWPLAVCALCDVVVHFIRSKQELSRKLALHGVRVVFGLAAIAFFGIKVGKLVQETWVSSEKASPYLSDRAFRELYLWANRNTKQGQVAVSLDFDILLNLIVYAPIDAYVSESLLSPEKEDVRWNALFEEMTFYGVTSEQWEALLELPETRATLRMRYGLYYGKYWVSRDFPPEMKKDLVAKFANVRSSGKGFSRRHTHWILSDQDLFSPQSGSAAEKIIATNTPLFSNSRYRVFALEESNR